MTRRLLVSGLLVAAALHAQQFTILHTNDLHAHLLPDKTGNGGIARLATAVRHEKANCPTCLFMNAGDLVQGTPVSTLFHGIPIYQISNMLGIDVGTLGNHEFDYGWKRVLEFINIANYPVVSANVVDASGKSISGKPYVIFHVGNLRIGVIGEVLGDLAPQFVSRLEVGPYKVLPVLENVRKYAAELHNQTDLVAVLGHIHDKEEVTEILNQIPDVSVVIAGHNHTAYPEMMNVDGRVAVLVDSYAEMLGRLDLDVDAPAHKLRSAKWTKIPLTADITPAPDVKKVVDEWEAKVSTLVDVTIGQSTKALERTSPELRLMVENAMAEQMHVDIGFIGKGNLREALPLGKVQARDIWNMLPFDDVVVIGKFKGSALPPNITDRHPVDPNREYTVVTTEFTEQSQSAPTELGATGMVFPKKGPLQRDVMLEWVKKKKIVP